MVMPGDNVNLEVELITPIACEEGLRFAIREGGRTVGAGVVTKILGVSRHGRRNESSSRSNAPTCRERNYSTTKNKRANAEKLELSKFCSRCRKHTESQGNEVEESALFRSAANERRLGQ